MNYLIKSSLFLLIPGLFAAGCSDKTSNTGLISDPLKVHVKAAGYSSGRSADSYVGLIEESQSVPLSFLTAGTVEKVLVEEGNTVKKGQILAALNNSNFENALRLAAAKEKQAKDGYDRLSAVYKNGSLPEVKMIEIETALEQAHSAVQIARKNVDDCNMVSPTDGIIGKRAIEPGMNVIPGSTVLTLVKINKVYVKVSVPENEISETELGQEAEISVGALNNKVFKGKIELKGVMANPISHTYEVKIALANPDLLLRPGMVCSVNLFRKNKVTCLSVPQQSVQVDNSGNKFLFVADSARNIAVKKAVQTGNLIYKGEVEIIDGIQEGELIITDGYQKINDQFPVIILR